MLRGVFSFLRRWLRPRRKKGLGLQPAPHTLVSRIDRSVADADMIRLAQESIRRGFPDQAETAYEKAAKRYDEHGMYRKAVAVHKALAALRPEDAAPWEAAAESYVAMGLNREAANALRKASVRHQKNGASDEAHRALRRARSLEDVSGGTPEGGPKEHEMPASGRTQSSPQTSLSDPFDDIESLIREGLQLEMSSLESEASAPKTPTSFGPESLPSVHVRPSPSSPPVNAGEIAETQDVELVDTVPPTPPRRSSLADAQTQYDPRGSAALEEARRRLQARGISADETRSADQAQIEELLARIEREPPNEE